MNIKDLFFFRPNAELFFHFFRRRLLLSSNSFEFVSKHLKRLVPQTRGQVSLPCQLFLLLPLRRLTHKRVYKQFVYQEDEVGIKSFDSLLAIQVFWNVLDVNKGTRSGPDLTTR
jgi:hypothetical protein